MLNRCKTGWDVTWNCLGNHPWSPHVSAIIIETFDQNRSWGQLQLLCWTFWKIVKPSLWPAACTALKRHRQVRHLCFKRCTFLIKLWSASLEPLADGTSILLAEVPSPWIPLSRSYRCWISRNTEKILWREVMTVSRPDDAGRFLGYACIVERAGR